MLRFARLSLLAWLAAAGVALWQAGDRLAINTDTADLLSSSLPFRQAYSRFQDEFPDLVDVFLAVVDGATPEQAEDGALALTAALESQRHLFAAVRVAGADSYFLRNALLFSSEDGLRRDADRLIASQALIGLMAHDRSLRGLASAVSSVLEAGGELDRGEIERLLEAIRPAFGLPRTSEFVVSWHSLFAPAGEPPPSRRLVMIKPRLDFSALLPAEPAMAASSAAIAAIEATHGAGLRIRVTGDAALAHEEMKTALSGAIATAMAAAGFVTLLLRIALGSAWLALASLLCLLVGLALTAGFATITVGELNLISIAFALLYVGLAVDYSIHFCLAYREALAHEPPAAALRSTITRLRSPLTLCTLSTSAGFFAFLPTSFSGVAQLGLIAGAGMFINLVLTLLLLPALLLLVPAPPPWPPRASSGAAAAGLHRHARGIVVAAACAAVVSASLLPWSYFDRDPLNLRAPDAESVSTLRDLLAANDDNHLLAITVLGRDGDSARALAARLRGIAEVGEVLTLDSLIPDASSGKLAIIDELALLLGPALAEPMPPKPAGAEETLAALATLHSKLRSYAATHHSAVAAELASQLQDWLRRHAPAQIVDQRRALQQLEQSLTGHLPRALERLGLALAPDSAPAVTLPESLRRQWVGSGGAWRISVAPVAQIKDDEQMRHFVDAVQGIAADATGEPVLNVRAGDEVVRAFQQAFLLAACAITVLLTMLLRRLHDVLVILLPLLLAALLTTATMVALGLSFNFANVIALPLLLGIGVDSAIHMVRRAGRERLQPGELAHMTTPRAVAFAGLTSLAGFGTLMLSPHPGMASMGAVLSIGVAWALLCTLLVLPAVLSLWPPRRT